MLDVGIVPGEWRDTIPFRFKLDNPARYDKICSCLFILSLSPATRGRQLARTAQLTPYRGVDFSLDRERVGDFTTPNLRQPQFTITY
jgi:hypothetical protein